MRFWIRISSFFKNIFRKRPLDPLIMFFKTEDKQGCADREDIFEFAKAVSNGDPEVVGAVRFILDEPIRYFHENSQKYRKRGIDFNNENFGDEFMVYDLLDLAAMDELESRGYVSRVSIGCGLSEFQSALARIKDYDAIKSAAEGLELLEDGDVAVWTEELNAALGGRAYTVFIIDMVEEKFSLAITDRETFEKINE